MRIQRNKVYALRDRLMLEDLDLSAKVEKIVFEVIGDFLQTHPKRSPHQLRRYILDNFTYEFKNT